MTRVSLQTSVDEKETKPELMRIARKYKLMYNGKLSYGRAIDYLAKKNRLEELERKDLL